MSTGQQLLRAPWPALSGPPLSQHSPPAVWAAGMEQGRDPGSAGAARKRWAPAAAARANQHRLPQIAPK